MDKFFILFLLLLVGSTPTPVMLSWSWIWLITWLLAILRAMGWRFVWLNGFLIFFNQCPGNITVVGVAFAWFPLSFLGWYLWYNRWYDFILYFLLYCCTHSLAWTVSIVWNTLLVTCGSVNMRVYVYVHRSVEVFLSNCHRCCWTTAFGCLTSIFNMYNRTNSQIRQVFAFVFSLFPFG